MDEVRGGRIAQCAGRGDIGVEPFPDRFRGEMGSAQCRTGLPRHFNLPRKILFAVPRLHFKLALNAIAIFFREMICAFASRDLYP
jgi:hypothetical protein